MTVLDEGIIAYLQGVAGITALVSTRVYGDRIPQAATLPCIVVQRIDTPRILTMQSSGATGDLIHPRFQLDAWATTHASAKAITDAIRATLHGKTGSAGGVTLRAALADNERVGWEPESQLYRGRSDYIVWHEEA